MHQQPIAQFTMHRRFNRPLLIKRCETIPQTTLVWQSQETNHISDFDDWFINCLSFASGGRRVFRAVRAGLDLAIRDGDKRPFPLPLGKVAVSARAVVLCRRNLGRGFYLRRVNRLEICRLRQALRLQTVRGDVVERSGWRRGGFHLGVKTGAVLSVL